MFRTESSPSHFFALGRSPWIVFAVVLGNQPFGCAVGQDALTLRGHGEEVYCVTFSPDGKRLATASGNSRTGTVRIWDAATGRQLHTLNTNSSTVAFSPDSKRLATASGEPAEPREIKIWNADSGKELLALRGHAGKVTGITFSTDKKRLASASNDHTVKLWDAGTGKELHSLPCVGECWSVSFSPDGAQLAAAIWDQSAGKIEVWDTATGRPLLTMNGHPQPVTCLAFSPDGRRLASASGDKSLKIWDASTSQELLSIQAHAVSALSVAFSPDGKQLASGGYDGSPRSEASMVKLWDASTGLELLSLQGHAHAVNSVAFSPDGKRIASASSDKTIQLRAWPPK